MSEDRITQQDIRWMSKALALARKGAGRVEPNPMVGCVIVRGGQIVGRGYHRRFGGPHAEAFALADAGPAARGATCYVTLEPCPHHGKTPPCTEALVHAGVAEVVAACGDPFEPVAGKGLRALRAAGIGIRLGPLAAEAQRLNAAYAKLRRTGRPLVLLKWAQSLDGKIATRKGDSKWITGEAARRLAHRLRQECQAVVVGIQTVIRDDPLLTARPARGRQPLRIVLDSGLRIPLDCQLVRTAGDVPVLVATTRSGLAGRRDSARKLERRDVEVAALPSRAGRVSLGALLDLLGKRETTNLLVEGGGRVHGSFIDQGLADRVAVFIAPRLIGGVEAVPAIAGRGAAYLTTAITLEQKRTRHLGGDLLIEADLHDPAGWWNPTAGSLRTSHE